MPKSSKERLAAIESLLPTIHDTLVSMDKKLDGLDHVVRGNGAPGLAAKVDVIANRVEAIEGGRSRWRDAFFTVAGGIVVGIVVSLFASQWSAQHVKPQQIVSTMQQKP